MTPEELLKELQSVLDGILARDNDRLVTASGAGTILGVSAVTVRKWAKAGMIPAYYTPDSNGRMKFWVSDVKKMARRKIQ